MRRSASSILNACATIAPLTAEQRIDIIELSSEAIPKRPCGITATTPYYQNCLGSTLFVLNYRATMLRAQLEICIAPGEISAPLPVARANQLVCNTPVVLFSP